MQPLVIDGHEDIAYSALALGRDFLCSAFESRAKGADTPEAGLTTLGLPEHLRGNVRVVFGTLYVAPRGDHPPNAPGASYGTPEEARQVAKKELEYYDGLASAEPRIMVIRSRQDLESVLVSPQPRLGIVVLMEGADPIVRPEDAGEWFRAGVRIVGPAWKGTRYSGGTGNPGPLTELGLRLMPELERARLILDTSHLSQESFWQALDLFHSHVIASHSNARKFVQTDRQLSDGMIRALVARGGVIGTVLYNSFLVNGWDPKTARKEDVTLMRAVDHIKYVCDLAGDARHAAIGSDLDGGFGAEAAPAEIDTIADLPRLGDALANAGFDNESISNILSENWLRVLRAALPDSD